MTIAPDARAVAIHVCPGKALPMRLVDEAELVAGRGIVGDRRFSLTTKPSNQATFIEEEALEAAAALLRSGRRGRGSVGVEVEPSARRNIVTRGVALNHLVGRTFRVGTAVVRGVELCEPCGHLAKMTSKAFETALLHRGGLRCEIVTSGLVRPGDLVMPG